MKTMKIELTVNNKKIEINVVNEDGVYSSFYDGMRLITGLQSVEEAIIYTKKLIIENKSGANFIFDN